MRKGRGRGEEERNRGGEERRKQGRREEMMRRVDKWKGEAAEIDREEQRG